MDDSAFKSILDGYEANRLSLDSWLTFWTWLVIIGVTFELAFIVWDHWEEKNVWQNARTHASVPMPERPSRVKLICELLSVLLVVVGIIGELVIEARLGHLETAIQDTNEKRVLQLQKEAGDAKLSSLAAAGAAQLAQESADAANASAREAQGKVRAVARQTALIESGTKVLKYILSGRGVQDTNGLKKQLEQFNGRYLVLQSYLNDSEGYFFCEQLLFTAKSAGMITEDQCAKLPFSGMYPFVGISVSGPDNKSILDLQKALSTLPDTSVDNEPLFPNWLAPHPPTLGISVGVEPFRAIRQGWPIPAAKNNATKRPPAKK